MAGINLLPIDLSPKRGSVKSSATIKKFTIILSGIFLIITLMGIILIVFLTSQINSSVTKQKNFTQNIQALTATEQKLFLIKDRIGKIKTAEANKNAAESFAPLNQIVSNLPNGVTISTVSVDSLKTKFSVLSKDSINAASFLNSLVASGTYKNLTLTGFAFTPENGYAITLEGS